MNTKPSILVTGGTGLLGAHLLAQLLLQGERPRALFRSAQKIDAAKHVLSYYTKDYTSLFKQIDWVKADILDLPALETAFAGIRQVYHCAAVVSFRKADEGLMRKVNIEGTANLLHTALEFGVEKFCYVSSIATLDKKEGKAIIDETDEWNPENNNYDYAISKHGGEMEVWRASQEGLPVVVVQPGVILGSGFWHHNTGNFFSNAQRNFRYYTEGITGFVSVDDVVRAMIQLMQSPIQNEAYILVSENVSYKQIMTQIAVALGKKPPAVRVTPLMAYIAWRWARLYAFFSGKPPFITRHTAQASRQVFRYSSDKIQRDLGFVFKDIQTSILKIARDFRKDSTENSRNFS